MWTFCAVSCGHYTHYTIIYWNFRLSWNHKLKRDKKEQKHKWIEYQRQQKKKKATKKLKEKWSHTNSRFLLLLLQDKAEEEATTISTTLDLCNFEYQIDQKRRSKNTQHRWLSSDRLLDRCVCMPCNDLNVNRTVTNGKNENVHKKDIKTICSFTCKRKTTGRIT